MLDTDLTLLDSARRMQPDGLIKIFDRYAPLLYRYALRLCNDPVMADQIVGDVFAKLLDQLATGSGPVSNLRSYLYEMTYHLYVDEMRYWHRVIPVEEVDEIHYSKYFEDGRSIFRNVEQRVLLETVLRAIQNDLTYDQRHVIILRFLEGFSLRETAKIIGKEVGNVKVIQNRAIAALRQAIGFKAPKHIGDALLAATHPSPAP
jgi:RNA polymerase sigma-70 factor, ECF subfamily